MLPEQACPPGVVAQAEPGMPSCSRRDSDTGMRMSSAPASTSMGTVSWLRRLVVS